jgi:HTH-type transcriptional regulator/antitoxin HigA
MSEDQTAANWFSKPGDSMRGIMQRRSVSAQLLAERIEGGLKTVRGLLDGSVAVDEPTAKSLASILGATPAFWLKRQENFEAAVHRAVARVIESKDDELLLSIPMGGAAQRGRMTPARREEEIRRRLVFFNVPHVDLWASRYGSLIGDTNFRTSNTFHSREDVTLLWLRRGELEADMVPTRNWHPENLRDRLESIRKLSKVRQPESFIPKLRALCADAGVALVVVKAPEGCTASGAARMVDTDKAMLLLSFRYRSDDQFWFTVFHEIGHLLLHKAHTFVDTENMMVDDQEREANQFAENCIVPETRQSEFESIGRDKDSVLRFSVSVGVAAGLVVGQMQHRDMLPRERLNYLKRRWTWQEINPAIV